MTIVANMRPGACRVRFQGGLGVSLACPGRVLAALGPLLGSFWRLLDVSWALFARFLNTLGRIWALMGASASILEGLWCLRAGCWRAPVAVFAMILGHAFCVSPLIYTMHELLQEIRIGISLGFRFPLAARRHVCCAHVGLQFLRNLVASC